MSDQTVRKGDQQMDREATRSDRVDACMKQLIPQVAANPNDYDIDVDLLDNGEFLEFLEEAFKPGGDVPAALAKLARAYNALVEKAAEDLASDMIDEADSMKNGGEQ